MKQIIKTSGLLTGITVINNLDAAMEFTSEKVKDIADILEQIDNNLEVEKND